jgi:hypothetical protein
LSFDTYFNIALDLQHLVPEERIDDQAVGLLEMMDEKTKKLALQILNTLASA